ncbi:MAG: group II intron reverse transcriptase/maturase [Candidatus Hydrogenedentes bacterium]|nr:group II intron reverse transcriptase/maturase [Candidatus Hydrogenedentota bacterium]
MLAALEKGVKGGKWFSLMDKGYSPGNLSASFTRVKRNKGSAGVDHQTVEHFEQDLEGNLQRLHQTLKDGSYVPHAVKRTWIPKPGSREKRPLGIPTVRDRVVQTALRNVLEPIFECTFAEHRYGFRPGRGCKDALRRVWQLLRQDHHFVVDADLKSYFDSIPQEQLLQGVEERVSDGRVLELLSAYLNQGVLDGMARWTPESGTPQGAVISPLLSNIYLNPLDHLMAGHGIEMVRYADDFVLLCKTRDDAERALTLVQAWVEQNGLTLHPEKTRIVDVRERGGFDFLGYHFERGYRWPRDKSIKKVRETIRGKTKRTNGQSLSCIIADINPVLCGWWEYFKHSHYTSLRHLDSWTRMRLRSILRKRRKLKGRGRGADHNRWPNAYFAAEGLFSLLQARSAAAQSLHR